jgi:hypothetical protein
MKTTKNDLSHNQATIDLQALYKSESNHWYMLLHELNRKIGDGLYYFNTEESVKNTLTEDIKNLAEKLVIAKENLESLIGIVKEGRENISIEK